jgi:hypothetical protein
MAPQRELGDEEIRGQVESLREYVRRGGDAQRWLASKDFTDGDLEAMRDRLDALRLARPAGREP